MNRLRLVFIQRFYHIFEARIPRPLHYAKLFNTIYQFPQKDLYPLPLSASINLSPQERRRRHQRIRALRPRPKVLPPDHRSCH